MLPLALLSISSRNALDWSLDKIVRNFLWKFSTGYYHLQMLAQQLIWLAWGRYEDASHQLNVFLSFQFSTSSSWFCYVPPFLVLVLESNCRKFDRGLNLETVTTTWIFLPTILVLKCSLFRGGRTTDTNWTFFYRSNFQHRLLGFVMYRLS